MDAATSLLNSINTPADLRQLERSQLAALASELRQYVLDSVSATGGHLSSNLGTVELRVRGEAIEMRACVAQTATSGSA